MNKFCTFCLSFSDRKQVFHSVDKAGRMRPKSYNTEKPSKKVCTGIFEDRDGEDTMVSFHGEVSANETVIEHLVSSNKQTEESAVSDNSCSNADYTQFFDNLTAEFNFGKMDEQVISEEKWNGMMFPHMTEQEELHMENSIVLFVCLI